MKIDITWRNLPRDSHETIRHTVETLTERHLKPALEAFEHALPRLHLTLEKRKLDHRVTARIQLPPRKVLVAQSSDPLLDKALHNALDELARQAARHRAHVSHQDDWRRKARRRRLRELKARLGALTPEVQQQSRSRWPACCPASNPGCATS